MLVIDAFPPGPTAPPAGFFRCAFRACPVRVHAEHVLCKLHPDAMPGDLDRAEPVQVLFPWR